MSASRLRLTLGATALAVLVTLVPGNSQAGSRVRYALVVGNNEGHVEGVELPLLQHAERDARALRERLLKYANFDGQRVALVVGGTREEVLAAAARLAERRRQDVAEMGELPSLFAVFFTGHGLGGRLLTADEPLTGADIAGVVRQMGATLSLGFFDACHAGGLDLAALRDKGFLSTPGFNPMVELPREVLDSEGTMWFASSRPEQLSYEDPRLGGLFTHYFLESFTEAEGDAAGVTLDAMWEYARRRTQSYAAERGRQQTPEKIVRELKARGPLYFSFPQERRARLLFTAEVEGTFVLVYEQSALVEQIEKQPGAPLEVATYEGPVTLRRLEVGDVRGASKQLVLSAGDPVLVQKLEAPPPPAVLGYEHAPMVGKGRLDGLEVMEQRESGSLLLGAGYRWAPVGDDRAGSAHLGELELGFARGLLSTHLTFGYGMRSQEYREWSYDLQDLGLRLGAGWGLDLGRLRLGLEGEVGAQGARLHYSDGQTRWSWGPALVAGGRVLWPIPRASPWLLVQARAGLQWAWIAGVGSRDVETRAEVAPALAGGIAVPLSTEW